MSDRASELRAIADGRLMLRVRNGVTVARSMLARIADEFEALSTALAEKDARIAEMEKLLAAVRDDAMRLDNDLCAMEATLDDMTSRYNKACVDIDAKDYRAEAAEARAARLEAALREARGHFIVERHDDGRISGIGHDSQALPKIVGILDAALSEDSVKEAG